MIAEARAHPEIIVFIDELHALVGAGRVGQGGLDAANLLKPPLARGELRCIGATTIEEYRRFIESDPALERRFENPGRGARPGRDARDPAGAASRARAPPRRALPDEALAAAVDLSVRFEPDRAAGQGDRPRGQGRRAHAAAELSLLRPTGAREGGVAPEAAGHPGARRPGPRGERGLPLDLVTETLDTGLGSRLLAWRLPARARARTGAGDRPRLAPAAPGLRLAQGRRGPLAVFLFLGPSGVGKTETARLLAEHLFGSASGTIRIDMSEYMEEHSVSRLIGSPPGYVGHEDEGQLTGAIRTKPHALLLLDEVEKAHPRVLDLFLQLFDEGRLADSKGRLADGRHLVVVMTSNLGAAARPAPGFVAPGPNDSSSARPTCAGCSASSWSTASTRS